MRALEINGSKFYQVPLTPWLSAEVLEQLSGVQWDAPHMVMVTQLLRRVHKLAALLLIPEGMTKEDFYAQLDVPGWTDEREEFFKYHLGLLNAGRVVKDFLYVNDLAGIMDLGEVIAKEFTTLTTSDESSMNLSPLPAEATSVNASQSVV